MCCFEWKRWVVVSGCLVLLLAVTAVAQEGAPTDGPVDRGALWQSRVLGGPVAVVKQGGIEQEIIKLSDYWIGVHFRTVTPELRTQLGLAEDEGILVEGLMPEGPAAEAGIEKHDVLIRAGEKKLTKVQDLIDEIDAVKEGKLDIELIRRAEKTQVEVSPRKRPPMESIEPGSQEIKPGDWKNFLNYMQEWKPGKDGRPAMKLRFWHPGMIYQDQGKARAPLPSNVKIEMQKQGDKPATITVTRGDETWEVTEEQLDQLPDDLRPRIARMLGKAGPAGVLGPIQLPDLSGMSMPLIERDGAIEKRFEDLNERLEQLRDSVEGLRENRGRKPKQEKPVEPKDEAPKSKPSGDSA